MEEKITIESTLKSSDTEEWWDIVFTRPLGFYIALFYKKLNITPNQVTIISIIIGIIAGCCFYFPKLSINIVGMLLLVFANLHDSADGQLARMTNNKTKLGRILDGVAGNIWFITIYVAICLRLTNQGEPAIWILGAVSGACHIIQATMADYYRNIHLLFIKGKAGSEVDNSKEIKEEYEALSWKKNFIQKIMLRFYLNYTKQQEFFSKNLQKLLFLIGQKYNNDIPEWLRTEFREKDKGLMKYTNILTFNTRMFVLFFCLFIDQPWIYFLFEVVVMNVILAYLILSQEKISKYFVKKIECLE
jgi:phosphatidylglycerophosphate synthase